MKQPWLIDGEALMERLKQAHQDGNVEAHNAKNYMGEGMGLGKVQLSHSLMTEIQSGRFNVNKVGGGPCCDLSQLAPLPQAIGTNE